MDAQNHYRQQSVGTASPAQLVSMLYHGAVAAVARAEGSLQAGGIEGVNGELQRAQAIVSELQVTLDFEQGGEIARNLDALYTFCTEQLIEANVKKDAAPLPAVRSTLAGLAAAWDEMVAVAETDARSAKPSSMAALG